MGFAFTVVHFIVADCSRNFQEIQEQTSQYYGRNKHCLESGYSTHDFCVVVSCLITGNPSVMIDCAPLIIRLGCLWFDSVVTHLFGTSNFICSRTHPPVLFSGLEPLFLLFILLFSRPILLNLTRGAWRLFWLAEKQRIIIIFRFRPAVHQLIYNTNTRKS